MAKEHVPLIDCFGCEYYRELQTYCIAHKKTCMEIEQCRWNELNAYRRLGVTEIRRKYGEGE